MSHKVRVHYINQSNEITTYFFSRAIRSMKNGIPGVNISGQVFPLYKGYFIDVNELDENKLKVNECPLMSKNEAINLIGFLPMPAFSGVAMSYAQDEIKNKKAPLKDVFNKQDQPISKEQSEKNFRENQEHFSTKINNLLNPDEGFHVGKY